MIADRIPLACRERFHAFHRSYDFRHPQGVVSVHDHHLTPRYDLATEEQLHRFLNLPVEFDYSPGIQLEDFTQRHLPFPESKRNLEIHIEEKVDVSVPVWLLG